LSSAVSIGTNNDVREASQLLNIEVKQIARSSMLVADQRHSRLQIAHAVQTQAEKNAADGSTAQACDLGNVEAVKPGADALRQRFPRCTTWGANEDARSDPANQPNPC
jgi:hypothetical protein